MSAPIKSLVRVSGPFLVIESATEVKVSGPENPTQFTKVDQTSDPRFFIEFLDARKTVEGEREVKELILDLDRKSTRLNSSHESDKL
jgi:hypothetical protein